MQQFAGFRTACQIEEDMKNGRLYSEAAIFIWEGYEGGYSVISAGRIGIAPLRVQTNAEVCTAFA